MQYNEIPSSIWAKNGLMDGGYSHRSNISIPAGYTYLMQFISHDLTFNRKRPGLNLESVYGIENKYSDIIDKRTGKFKFIEYTKSPPFLFEKIPDQRNTMTIMLLGIHREIMKYHNYLMDSCSGSIQEKFSSTRKRMIAIYHEIIRTDVLPLILQQTDSYDFLDPIPKSTSKYDLSTDFVFFHSAIFRFGHAMVQPSYRINSSFVAPVLRGVNDNFTGDLKGDKPYTEHHEIDWNSFFEIGKNDETQYSGLINTKIARPLFDLPRKEGAEEQFSSIVYLTLFSSIINKVPTTSFFLKKHRNDDQIGNEAFKEYKYDFESLPIWLYILKEAELLEKGSKLGPLGSRLVANTFSFFLIDNHFFNKNKSNKKNIVKFTDILQMNECI